MDKKVTMKDIATSLGLSINAVSLALNNKNGVGDQTRNQILDTADQMGYFTENMKYSTAFANKNICVLTKTEFFRDTNFYGKVVLGVEQEAKLLGYDININFVSDSMDTPACVEQQRVCGIILVGRISDEYIQKLMAYHLPMVMADHVSLHVPLDSIMTDNKHGAYQITGLLVEKGFTKIGFFGDFHYSMSVKERFFGYQEGISLLPFLKSYPEIVEYSLRYSVVEDVEQHVIEHNTAKIIERIQSIEMMPEALVCSNDVAAIQVMRALDKMGYKVPQDISVVGFDDIEFSTICIPKLTTVHVRKESMGKAAVQKLLWRMDHPDKAHENTILSVQVVERDSVRIL